MASTFVGRLLLAGSIAGCAAQAEYNTTEIARRLQATSSTSFSQACNDACPGLQSMMTSLNSQLSGMTQLNTPQAMEDMMNTVYDNMCSHQDTYRCMVRNAQTCGLNDASGSAVTQNAGQVDCICVACPTMKRGFAHFTGQMVGAMSGGSSGGLNSDAMMRGVCAMADGMECAANRPSECSAMFSGSGASLASFQNNIPALKQTCADRGFPTNVGAASTLRAVSPLPLAVAALLAVAAAAEWAF